MKEDGDGTEGTTSFDSYRYATERYLLLFASRTHNKRFVNVNELFYSSLYCKIMSSENANQYYLWNGRTEFVSFFHGRKYHARNRATVLGERRRRSKKDHIRGEQAACVPPWM
jgi:hypothetical protein